MGRRKYKEDFTPAVIEYITAHLDLPVKDLAFNTGISQARMYYFLNSNKIEFNNQRAGVKKYLKTIGVDCNGTYQL